MEYGKSDILTIGRIAKIHNQWKDLDCNYIAELINAYAIGRFGKELWQSVLNNSNKTRNRKTYDICN